MTTSAPDNRQDPLTPQRSYLRQRGEAAGFLVADTPDGLLWSRAGDLPIRFRLLPLPAVSSSLEQRKERGAGQPETRNQKLETGLTVWVGDESDEGDGETGPTDFFLDAQALEETSEDGPAVLTYPRAHDERMHVVEAQFFPSAAGDQCILTLESPRLARDLRAGQFVNIALTPPDAGPFAPVYRVVEGWGDAGGGEALRPDLHHLARVPLSMLRVYREGSRLPSGVGPLPPEIAYRLRPARADRVSVAIRDVGTGTRALCRAQAGDPLQVLGPLGLPERVPEGVRRVVLLGGGVGFAPLYAIAEQLHWRRIPTLFLAGARVQEHLFPWPDAPGRFVAPEFQELDLQLMSVTEERDGKFATDLLADVLASEEGRATDLVYVCGPSPMMARAAAVCESYGIACRAFLEKQMECSVGVCMSCVVRHLRDDGTWGNARVCREGTVFDAARVRW